MMSTQNLNRFRLSWLSCNFEIVIVYTETENRRIYKNIYRHEYAKKNHNSLKFASTNLNDSTVSKNNMHVCLSNDLVAQSFLLIKTLKC